MSLMRKNRRPRENQREALLDAAFETLARTGDVAPNDIAREAGASKALIFHHFSNLQGLHDAMVERVLRETQAGLDALAHEARDPRARLTALTRALLAEPPEAPRETRHISRFWLADDERGRLRDALITDFIEKTTRELRSRADARAIANLILTRWHGATTLYANGNAVDFETDAEHTARDIETLLRA